MNISEIESKFNDVAGDLSLFSEMLKAMEIATTADSKKELDVNSIFAALRVQFATIESKYDQLEPLVRGLK